MLWIDQYRYGPPPPATLVGFPSMQNTGAGTNTVTLGYPAGIQNGDTVVVICRKDDPWGTLPSGFSEKADYVYFSPNDISVVTGVYNSVLHGANFSVSYAGGGNGVTRAILYAVRNASPTVSGFVTSTQNGNDKFFPAISTPGTPVAAFAFGFAGDNWTDEQANGWTDDWEAGNARAYSKVISSAGTQTMPRWDNIGNASMVAFYLV